MGPGKLMVVIRFVATGTLTMARSSSVTRWIASGGSANAAVATSRSRLIGSFIFEVADSGGKTTVGSHIGVANEAEIQFEVEGFVEGLFLKDAGADQLAGDCRQNFVLARGQNV